MSRRRQRQGLTSTADPVPFLSIMLGLMSFMALVTLGLSVEQRQRQAQTQTVVQLTDIPDGFLPLAVRCRASSLEWQDDGGAWRRLSGVSLMMLLRHSQEPIVLPAEARRFLDFLTAKAAANRRLSYQNRQHTVLLWIEPDGVETSDYLAFLVDSLGLPLRLGRLPLFQEEQIRHAPSAP